MTEAAWIAIITGIPTIIAAVTTSVIAIMTRGKVAQVHQDIKEQILDAENKKELCR